MAPLDFAASCTMNELSSVSDDILMDHILLKLPLKSLFRCSSVCKAWRGLVSECWAKGRLPLVTSAVFYRCSSGEDVLVRKEQRSYACTSHDGHLRDHGLEFFPLHRNAAIVDCCNGLLLCRTSASPAGIHVLNPTTRRWLTLPESCRRSLISVLAFDPGHSSEFKVVSFVGWLPQGAQVEVFSSRTMSWVEREVDFGVSTGAMSATMRYFDGVLHVLAYPNYVVCVDLEEMTCRRMELPEAMEREGCIGKCMDYLHYTHVAGGGRLRIWMLGDARDGCPEWKLKHNVDINELISEWSRAGPSVPDLPLTFHQLHFLAFHPEKEWVYVWVEGKLVAYDLNEGSSEVVSESEKEGERVHAVQVWLFPFTGHLFNCLPDVVRELKNN